MNREEAVVAKCERLFELVGDEESLYSYLVGRFRSAILKGDARDKNRIFGIRNDTAALIEHAPNENAKSLAKMIAWDIEVITNPDRPVAGEQEVNTLNHMVDLADRILKDGDNGNILLPLDVRDRVFQAKVEALTAIHVLQGY